MLHFTLPQGLKRLDYVSQLNFEFRIFSRVYINTLHSAVDISGTDKHPLGSPGSGIEEQIHNMSVRSFEGCIDSQECLNVVITGFDIGKTPVRISDYIRIIILKHHTLIRINIFYVFTEYLRTRDVYPKTRFNKTVTRYNYKDASCHRNIVTKYLHTRRRFT